MLVAGIETREFTYRDFIWMCNSSCKQDILKCLGFTFEMTNDINKENFKSKMESKHYITIIIKILDEETGTLYFFKRICTFYDKESITQIADFLVDGTYITYNKNNETQLGKDIAKAYNVLINYFVDIKTQNHEIFKI